MRLSFHLAILLTGLEAYTLAANVPRAADWSPAQNDVVACRAIIAGLQASAFCSSFVPIQDAAYTATQTGTVASIQVTVTAPCTNAVKKCGVLQTTPRLPSTTPAAPSKTPRAPSTTPAAPSTTARISTTSSSSSKKATTTARATLSQCSLKGVPPAFAAFACEIIREACLSLVEPKAITVTTFKLGPTSTRTKTMTPTCPITTTRVRTTSTAPSITHSTTPWTTPSITPSTTPSTTPPTTPSTTPSTTTSSSPPPHATCSYPSGDIATYCGNTRCIFDVLACYVYLEGFEACFNDRPANGQCGFNDGNKCVIYASTCCPDGSGKVKRALNSFDRTRMIRRSVSANVIFMAPAGLDAHVLA